MTNEEDANPLHDIHPEIAYGDLENIDLEPFSGAPDEDIANYLRSIAQLASIGQLKQAMNIPFDDEDRDREVLIEMFVEKKMAVVLRIKREIDAISQL